MRALEPVYIVDACRTPVGRYRGDISAVRPDDLAATVLRALIARNPGVPPDQIEDVVMGAANQAGEDNRNVARMAVLLSGLPVSVPGVTVNRLCGSSLQAVNQAATSLVVGDGEIAIAGGVESMSRAPWVLPRPGEALPRKQEIFDTKLGWRLVNPKMPDEYTISLGETAEVLASEMAISREDQDRFSYESHMKAIAAWGDGCFEREVVPVEVTVPRHGNLEGSTVLVARDSGPRADTTLEALATLPPVFKRGGTVTAGNSSPLNDGAAAVILATEHAVERLGLEPMVRIVASAVAGVEPQRMGIGPVPAMEKALSRAGWKLDELVAVELNEAFAAQSLAVMRLLHLDPEKVNPLGGAIALGHPLGCSGARILTTLVHELSGLASGSRGAATMCIGVGQGIATLVERV